MTRVALRSLAARKLRTALTAIAVLLGVAMVAGSYIETDQIRGAFDDISRESVSKLDVVVTPREEFSSQFGMQLPTLPSRLVSRVRTVGGVAAARGGLSALGQMVVDGEPVETFGAPGLVIADSGPQFDPSTVVAGRDPASAGEAAVIEQNAEDQGLEIGDTIGVVTRHGIRDVRIVGIFAFGEGSLGGTTAVELTRADVRRWFDLENRVSSISVIAAEGVTPSLLSQRISAALPETADVRTADESADETADEINDQIGSFLTPALLALAGAAVLVGAFIIFNTFSITVAQRTREFAMLRALGATRGQVLAGVCAEALVIGVLASALGLAAGIGFAALLNALFDAAGFGIPRSGLTLKARTIAIALGVGIGATQVAALVPALRATRVAPLAAMSSAPPLRSARARRLGLAATALCVLVGAALMAQGLFGSGSATAKLGSVGGGAVVLFVGVALTSRYAVRPLARLIGYPIERLFKVPGRLARENAERNPGRTAVTSAALMVGLGLVVFVAVFAAGLRSSFAGQLDDLVRADMIVYSQGFSPFSPRAARIADGVPGVAAAVPQLFDQVEVNGEKPNIATDVVIGVDPRRLSEIYSFDWIEGDDGLLTSLGSDETLIEEQFGLAHGVGVGDRYEVVTPSGGRATLRAAGIYRDPTILQGSIAAVRTLRRISPARDPISLLIAVDEGADADAVQAAVERALERFPTLEVENRAQYRETISAQLDQIVYLLYALLALSVVISLFGIANSLYLSIHERTAELGVLRAIGTTREQVRRVIRYESVITSVIGGVLGLGLGTLFAIALILSLSEFGLTISIPIGELAAFMALAVIVGVVGAIAPARRASRTDVLAALHHE